jgi:uncharacterized membrane protein HdeD (DUF308 family)
MILTANVNDPFRNHHCKKKPTCLVFLGGCIHILSGLYTIFPPFVATNINGYFKIQTMGTMAGRKKCPFGIGLFLLQHEF